MTDRNKNIEHPGIIEKIENSRVWVGIQPQSACGSCHSKSYCGMSEVAEKIVEVQPPTNPEHFHEGQHVVISLRKTSGYRALFMGYLIPFIILLAALILLLAITGNEALSAMVSIMLLIPYYLALYLNRDKIRSSFRFFIK